MPRLHILSPREIARTIELTENLITFGRSAENVIQIGEPNVSSRHGILVRNGEGYQLHDFNSTNGTFVNGERILAVKLPQEAVIRFGPVELKYETAPASPAPAPLGAKTTESGMKPMPKKEPGMSKRLKPEFAGSQLGSGPVVLQPGFSKQSVPETSDRS